MDRSPRRPLSSSDFISRYLLTVSSLEGVEGQILNPYIWSYVGRTAKIFSPLDSTRPPLSTTLQIRTCWVPPGS